MARACCMRGGLDQHLSAAHRLCGITLRSHRLGRRGLLESKARRAPEEGHVQRELPLRHSSRACGFRGRLCITLAATQRCAALGELLMARLKRLAELSHAE
jgi:hypothetical protein